MTRVSKQVIVIRKDLGCRKGKLISQGAHASMKVLLDLMPRNRELPTDGGGGIGKHRTLLHRVANGNCRALVESGEAVGAREIDERVLASLTVALHFDHLRVGVGHFTCFL